MNTTVRITKCISLIILISIFSCIFSQKVLANLPAGVGISIQITDPKAVDGDIISSSTKGYQLAKIEYDPNMYGVISDLPALAIQDTVDPKTKLVLSSGTAYVNVTTKNGAIKINDPVTSSTIPGNAEKAQDSGFMLGTALEDYTNKDTKAVGKILVLLSPHYAGLNATSKTNLLKGLKTFTSGGYLTPIDTLRYSLAGLLTICAFILGFMYFGKVAVKGIESVGRNPLAGRLIQLSVLLNVLLAISIVAIGMTISYFILII